MKNIHDLSLLMLGVPYDSVPIQPVAVNHTTADEKKQVSQIPDTSSHTSNTPKGGTLLGLIDSSIRSHP